MANFMLQVLFCFYHKKELGKQTRRFGPASRVLFKLNSLHTFKAFFFFPLEANSGLTTIYHHIREFSLPIASLLPPGGSPGSTGSREHSTGITSDPSSAMC